MKKRFHAPLYFWVLFAVLLGIVFGISSPEKAVEFKFLGELFVALVKMFIAPLVFCSIAYGISSTEDLKKVARIGGKAFIYFEVVSSLALLIGLAVAHIFKPGSSLHARIEDFDTSSISDYAQKAHDVSLHEFLSHLIPKTFFDPVMSGGDLLQVLLIAILTGFAIHALPEARKIAVNRGLETTRDLFFKMISMVIVLAPLGAFGAMAFTVGKYGFVALKPLASLLFAFYATCFVFIFCVLGLIARMIGFRITFFLKKISDEIFVVLGTSSSESALAKLMEKLESFGCSKTVVGLVVPAGYSFNLDGTNIYMTLACLFVAQALGIELSFSEQLTIFLIAAVTSKGASGVTGAGFITLAATLTAVPKVPVAGLALILGVDRFMSEARAITNMIGNGIATLAIARLEGELDLQKMRENLR